MVIKVVPPLPQQIFPRDPKVQLAGVETRGDVTGGQQLHLHAGQTLDAGAIAALAAVYDQPKAAVIKPGLRLFLQSPLGRKADGQGFGHSAGSDIAQARAGRTMQPTAPTSAVIPGASCASRPTGRSAGRPGGR